MSEPKMRRSSVFSIVMKILTAFFLLIGFMLTLAGGLCSVIATGADAGFLVLTIPTLVIGMVIFHASWNSLKK